MLELERAKTRELRLSLDLEKERQTQVRKMIVAYLSSLAYMMDLTKVFQIRLMEMMPSGCLGFVCFDDIYLYAE